MFHEIIGCEINIHNYNSDCISLCIKISGRHFHLSLGHYLPTLHLHSRVGRIISKAVNHLVEAVFVYCYVDPSEYEKKMCFILRLKLTKPQFSFSTEAPLVLFLHGGIFIK